MGSERTSWKWKYRHWALAKRLGLVCVAQRIHDRDGPWILPTAKAYFLLQSLGMFDDPAPEAIVSVGVYR